MVSERKGGHHVRCWTLPPPESYQGNFSDRSAEEINLIGAIEEREGDLRELRAIQPPPNDATARIAGLVEKIEKKRAELVVATKARQRALATEQPRDLPTYAQLKSESREFLMHKSKPQYKPLGTRVADKGDVDSGKRGSFGVNRSVKETVGYNAFELVQEGKPFYADKVKRREWDPELHVDGYGEDGNASKVSAYNEIVRVMELGERPKPRWPSRIFALSEPAAPLPLQPQQNERNVPLQLHSQEHGLAVYEDCVDSYTRQHQDETKQSYLKDMVADICEYNGVSIDTVHCCSAEEEKATHAEEQQMRAALPKATLPTAYRAQTLYRQSRMPFLRCATGSGHNRQLEQTCDDEWAHLDSEQKSRFVALHSELSHLRTRMRKEATQQAVTEEAEPTCLVGAPVTRYDGDKWVNGTVAAFVKLGTDSNSSDEWPVAWEAPPPLTRAAAACALLLEDTDTETAVQTASSSDASVPIDTLLLERLLVRQADRQLLRQTVSYMNQLR